MTKYILVEAIGNINDRHISESASFHRKTMSKAWIILSAASAACIALIFVALPVVRFFTVNNSSDPYWSETHLQVSSSEEAIRKFGDDLLIDKMVLDNISDDPYEAYTLTFSNRDSELRSNWERLLCEIYYGRFYHEIENPNIF